VKQLCQVTRGRKDGITAWINIDSEPKVPEFKDCWDLVVKSKCDNIARLVSLPPWDCEIGDDYLVSKEQERDRLTTPPTKFEVQLDGKSTQVVPAEDVQAIPTPRASPPPTGRKPLPVAKQSKLPFGAQKPTITKAGKIAKPRGRKPKQVTKTQQAPNTAFLQTFKASKNISEPVSDKKPGKRSPLPDRQPFREKPNAVMSLPSPGLDVRIPERIDVSTNSPISPTTPTTPDNRLRETISPKSIPNNMRNLIDAA
jgi:NAD-dependent histone deacetylase SIR2